MLSELLIWAGAAIWVVGIPIAAGFWSRVGRPRTFPDLVGGIFWPIAVVAAFAYLALGGLWWIVRTAWKGLYRFGGWLHDFFLGK